MVLPAHRPPIGAALMSIRSSLRMVLALRCEEATALASKALDGPLSASERIALGGHTVSCGSCRRFLHQIRMLRTLAHGTDDPSYPRSDSESNRLSADARARIVRHIRDESRIDLPE